ncbi:ATP synthase F1 subunit epsilon [Coriobacteriales bacterium OH1046]|nr:ATP synthase F1 subunit epsilon [Coriobacteriales bacterium OH1046]
MKFDVTINTPQGLYKQTKASIVNVVSPDGQRGILPNHMPIVVSLTVSKMTMDEEERETYAISGGVLYFRNNRCTILVPAIENVRDIDLERAEKARERAEERLRQVNDEHIDMVRAQVSLQRAINRISIKNGR